MKKLLLSCCLALGIGANAQTVLLNEGFNNVATLVSTGGWIRTNQSSPLGTGTWGQGNSSNFPSHTGTETQYATVGYSSTTGGTGTISNWLITPTVNVKDGDKLSFYTRVPSNPTEYADRLEVRSSTGTMTQPSGATGIGSFTKLHLTINENLTGTGYPGTWTPYVVTVSGVGSTPVATNFAFRYFVTNGGPSGANSNIVGLDTVVITDEPPVVSAPTCATLTAPANNATNVAGKPTLSWGAVTGTDSYDVLMGTSASNLSVVANVVGTSYTPTEFLSSNTEYFWSVTPKNSHGSPTGCDVNSFTVKTLTPPACPVILSPADGATGIAYNPTPLSWSKPAGTVTGYDVYWGTNSSSLAFLGTLTSTNETVGANINNTLPNTTYYWRIVAKNDDGESAGCTTQSLTTMEPSPYCTAGTSYGTINPTNCNGTTAATTTYAYTGEYSTVNVLAGNTYKFDIVGKTGYTITIATNSTTPVGLAYGVNTVTYNATTTGALRFYSHQNSDCSGADDSSTTHTRSVTCMGETLAVSDIKKANVSVYPNPFADVVKISDVKDVKSISINDASGRQVKTLAPAAELNLSSLKSGMYIINLNMVDGSVKSIKAIKK